MPDGVNYSLYFDGTDDWIRVFHNDNLLGSNLSNGFTIAFWAWKDTAGLTTGRIMDKADGANGDGGFAIYQSNTGLIINIDAINAITANVLPDVWNHCVITVAPISASFSRVKMFTEGIINANGQSGSISSITTTKDMIIANAEWIGMTRTLTGYIRSIKIWNVTLTPEQAMEEYKTGNVLRDSLIYLYDFQEGSGTIVKNLAEKIYVESGEREIASEEIDNEYKKKKWKELLGKYGGENNI
jgi:hypothetical protein